MWHREVVYVRIDNAGGIDDCECNRMCIGGNRGGGVMDYIADEDVTVNRLVRSIGWIALVVPLVYC